MEENENHAFNGALTVILFLLLCINFYRTERLTRDVAQLKAQIEVDSIRYAPFATDTLPDMKQEAPAKKGTPAKKETTAKTAPQSDRATAPKTGPVSVKSQIRIKNRSTLLNELPDVKNGPEGTVSLYVRLNDLDMVGAVRVLPESTIKDEDIVEACTTAALHTMFMPSFDKEAAKEGTITYIFTAMKQ